MNPRAMTVAAALAIAGVAEMTRSPNQTYHKPAQPQTANQKRHRRNKKARKNPQFRDAR